MRRFRSGSACKVLALQVELCLPRLIASRVGARRRPSGFRPGFWPQGQCSQSTPRSRLPRFRATGWLGLLTEPEPLTDLRHEAGHGQTLRPRQSRRASAALHPAAPLRLRPPHRSQAAVGLGPLHRQREQRSPQIFRQAHPGRSIHRIAEGADGPCCRSGLVGVCGTRFDSARAPESPASASNVAANRTPRRNKIVTD